MASDDPAHRRNRSANEIPLQDLDSNGNDTYGLSRNESHRRTVSDRGRPWFRSSRAASGAGAGRYAPIGERSPSPPQSPQARGPQSPRVFLQTPSGQHQRIPDEDDEAEFSHVADRGAFQAAIGFAGLSFNAGSPVEDGEDEDQTPPRTSRSSRPVLPSLRTNSIDMVPVELNDGPAFLSPGIRDEDDTQPLTSSPTEPRSTLAPQTAQGQRHDRHSIGGVRRPSVRFSPIPHATSSRLGDDLNAAEVGNAGPNSSPRRSSSSRNRSLSPSSVDSPLARTSTMLRKMSQRVVNLSNEPESARQSIRRRASTVRRPRAESQTEDDVNVRDFASADGAGSSHSKPPEKTPDSPIVESDPPQDLPPIDRNPLRGKSLGLFSRDSRVRQGLLQFLTHPILEPFILVLIVVQTVVLAVGSAQPVYSHPRPTNWGNDWADYTIFVIFIIYTAEIAMKVVVSGLIFNATEYSTIDRSIGVRQALTKKANDMFALHRKPSVRKTDTGLSSLQLAPPTLLRSLTAQNIEETPGSSRQAQKMRLAHRAFLRHSFNRLDFVAVIAYWISFILQSTGVEHSQHIYVFDMLSCLRVLRLLSITGGTSVILRSLKRAAPTLLNIGFLIGFFWLLFAIVGVQSFKSSLRRYCVWDGSRVDPGLGNWTANSIGGFQFCGGYLKMGANNTLDEMPWIHADGSNGTSKHKGFLCPVGSYCVESTNPYNNTVSYDNIFNSLELVFVIMSSNTFTDLMYDVCDSDYLAAALFSAFGIIVMSLWLINLLIAVITSSLQVIREESRSSAFMDREDPAEDETLEDEDDYSRKSRGLHRLYEKTRWVWISAIVYGLVTACLKHATMKEHTAKLIEISQITVTLILLAEIIIRIALDRRDFFHHRTNWADLTLAVITSVILLPQIRALHTPYAWLSIFQILRIYRVVLAVPITRDLITVVFRHVSGLLNLILFAYLLTFLAAIFAAQLFRGELPTQDDDLNDVQVTFATIFNSFTGMYQLLSSENWTSILYDVTRFTVRLDTAWIGAGFLILWYMLANFIVLNMFIAVIQENFDVSEDQKRLQQVRMFLHQKELGGGSHGTLSLSTIFKFGRNNRQDPLDYGQAATEMLLKDAVIRDFLDDILDEIDEETATPRSVNGFGKRSTIDFEAQGLKFWNAIYERVRKRLFDPEPNPFYTRPQLSSHYEELDPRTLAKEVVSAAEQRKVTQRQYLRNHPSYNVSLFFFKNGNPVRSLCQRIVGPGRGSERIEGRQPNTTIWYAFSAFIYAAIVAMVVLACVTTPLYQKEYFYTHGKDRLDQGGFFIKNWFAFTDVGFAALFTIEAIIKVIADGFFWTPHAYFRSSWGFIDGIVLITMWANVLTSFTDPTGGSRTVGAFKALRALRLLNVSDSARDTFHSVIILGGWKVVSAAFVSLSLLIPFAIYGLNLFAGTMTSCNDGGSNIFNLTDCVGEYENTPYNWTVLAPRQVSNSYYDFDNFGNSLFILFQIVSQEGWTDLEWSAESITGVFTQPEPWTQQGNAVFFIIFNLLGAVFVLTLFVSVFMRNYTEQTGVAFLTTEQRSWLELRKLLRQVAPSKRPSTKKKRETWQEWCYRRAVTKTGWWQRMITGVLIFHLILLCLEYYPEPWWWERTRDYLFLLLTVIYIVNIVVRIIGLTWFRFSRSAWDVYSVLSVFGTVITTVLLLSQFTNRIFVQLHKLFLVSVALLLIPRNNQLDQLFKTAAASLTSILNLLATWFVLFIVFAIAMTQSFGLTRFGDNETGNLNLRTVPKAMILLFRSSMGEGWNQIMEDFAGIEYPLCTIGDGLFNSDCGSKGWARALFISWNILSMYIFVNLFISLIYESFSYVYQRSSGLSAVSREEIRRFKQAWAEYDPSGTGYITKQQFPRFLGELSGLFEMRIYDSEYSVGAILEDCRKKSHRTSSLPVDGPQESDELDLEKLNKRLAEIPVGEVRQRRARMNTFYEEVLVSADPTRGISFNALLMILAHYKVISASKSLRLEEYLRRRARLQRVEEAVNRNVVVGFFDTLYWSRRFRRVMEARRAARMTELPQFEVPEIFIHDEGNNPMTPASPGRPIPSLSVTPVEYDPSDSHESLDFERRGSASGSATGSAHSGSMRNRSSSIQITPQGSPSGSPSGSPTRESHLSARHKPTGSQTSIQPDWHFAAALEGSSPPGSPRLTADMSVNRSRANSAVSQTDMMGAFDSSAWGESLRRSYTTQRGTRRGSNRRPPSGS
ncbi:hypothetical protein K431DRAFT_283641 [Polychaeton citri CBS 116435]|uniref:Calcium-channel protein CCH1 n=1 Tax=Polychaeton citri CBS 116435 TaxID=1314669 RepID=A0A9P4QAH7_9PEZI|nr:hypothetical protein K431DRAFT_283641 [Polychaeton citri CBS 116435]